MEPREFRADTVGQHVRETELRTLDIGSFTGAEGLPIGCIPELRKSGYIDFVAVG